MAFDFSLLKGDIRKKAEKLSKDIDFSTMSEKGANSFVLFGHNRVLKRDVVVKFYYWGAGDHAEPELLAQLDSEFILKVYHAESLNDDDAYFMTPYCASGDLLSALEGRKFGIIEAIDTVGQVAAGTSFLHASGYLHRDLKPENVFCISVSKFVIGDFGSVVAQGVDGYASSKTRHSLIYRTPEEIIEKKYCRQGDVYQLGILLYQLLGGNLPYNERDWLSKKEKSIYDGLNDLDAQCYATSIIEQKIVKGKILDFNSLPPWVCKSLKGIIRKCCSVSIGSRYERVSDLASKLNNIRSHVADWRIDEHPVLYGAGKQLRIVTTVGGPILIEQRTRTEWRRKHAFKPNNLSEAVTMCESV